MQLPSADRRIQDDLPLLVDSVEIEDILGDVQADPLWFHFPLPGSVECLSLEDCAIRPVTLHRAFTTFRPEN
jgi:hypothetical protein